MENYRQHENKGTKNLSKIYHKFTLRELGGAFGDWGTLIPFIIGYVAIIGFNPAGIFLTLGLTNIILGIRFNLPLPVQPQKTIGTVAIAEQWSVTQVISTGLATGVIWMGLGTTKILNKIAKAIPKMAIRSIQLGLALILTYKALDLIWGEWIVAAASLTIIILLAGNKKISSAIILTIVGIAVLIQQGNLTFDSLKFALPVLQLELPSLSALWQGMLAAGFAQLFLTLTNVMVATVNLAHDLFPQDAKSFDANVLAQNMGFMNIANPFIGGIPLCHGSGGLAAQYAFGARTGGSMIIEGIIELTFGLFFSSTLLNIFQNFPEGILGAMLIFTAVLLGKVGVQKSSKKELPFVCISAVICLVFNISWGFLAAIGMYLVWNCIIHPLLEKKTKIM